MNAAASFSQDEIQLAHELKANSLPWNPQPGHYVWDGEPLIRHESPFHDRVFFILDLKHFLRRSETIERLVESMVWLPTWEQCRVELANRSVPVEEVSAHLRATDALANQTERRELYVLLLRTLS